MCGSRRISRRRVRVPLRGRAPVEVSAEVCADCGEQYFSLETMRELDRARGLA